MKINCDTGWILSLDSNYNIFISQARAIATNTSKFMEELFKKQQKLRFSGAGASHQNGAGRRTRYQDSGQYGKCHIDASLDGMS